MAGHMPLSLRWRVVTITASLTGFACLATLWILSSERQQLLIVLFTAPFTLALLAAFGTMAHRVRVIALWFAAALSGLLAALSIMSGIGLIVLAVTLVYLWLAWNLNDERVTADQ